MALNFSRLENISRALKNSHQTGQCFHTSFVYHGSKLLNISFNNYNKQHPHHKWTEYKPKRSGDNYQAGIHAECRSLIALGLDDCSHLTFVNVRIDNNGNPAKSKPCNNCYRLLREYGYKTLWYYDGTEYVKEKY